MNDRAAEVRMLLELKSDLWIWRIARVPDRRRAAALRVRWKLRKLAGAECHAEAWRMVQEASETGRRCGGKAQHPQGFQAI